MVKDTVMVRDFIKEFIRVKELLLVKAFEDNIS